ncbi:ProQ/FINO family protein [Saccharospirillum impatiens]|uniref:ProQ/FINO family protein n=1 Tax=Saccharospirillum impatiens TaxID=169438 RepID=UPI00041814E9|nr:ProQ/FINO family protein [Saccharospirillum impatiens]
MTEQNPTDTEAAQAPAKRKTDAQRKKEFDANRKAMDELCELYPEAFNPRKPKPLKIGIHEALAEDGKLSKTRIRRALNVYVRLRSYYACMLEGVDRVTIDGSPTGQVSAEDAAHAKEKFDAIEKRRAERAKQRPPAANRKPRADGDKPEGARKPRGARPSRPRKDNQTAPAASQPAPETAKPEDSLPPEDRMKRKLEMLVNKTKN